MISINTTNVAAVSVENEWNFSSEQEMLMHTIHAYPAKFPAFIAQKAFEYAKTEMVNVHSVADIFCGCGTVALEAKLHSVDFWGCDINPVATLIASVKSDSYSRILLEQYFMLLEINYNNRANVDGAYAKANERLQYWYTEASYSQLQNLKDTIMALDVEEEKYREAFLCIFSSILKATSKWLTKSIKPQIDPEKHEIDVWNAFSAQYNKFIRAVEQINERHLEETEVIIENRNFIDIVDLPRVDMIISSPPYVTSYEYADLHQLSALWLDYAEDYRVLRRGSIGSAYNSDGYDLNLNELNDVGRLIVNDLLEKNGNKKNAKIRSVARYYCNMQRAIRQCAKMINSSGMVFFVVGDTEYKGVQIRNSEHLICALRNEGFSDIKAAKRRISNKLCIPYRDASGRFSSDKSQRTIYHEEYIISGRMWHV